MLSRHDFPQGFVFGTATSAYQIEGHAFGGAGRCHWDSFAATPGNVVRAENGDRKIVRGLEDIDQFHPLTLEVGKRMLHDRAWRRDRR